MGKDVVSYKPVTDKVIERAGELLGDGGSLRSVAKELGVEHTTLWKAMRDRGADIYAAALERRAAEDELVIQRISEGLEGAWQDKATGKIDPRAAEVAMKGRMWLAERRDRKRYGQQPVIAAGGGGITLNITNYGKQQEVIDGECERVEYAE